MPSAPGTITPRNADRIYLVGTLGCRLNDLIALDREGKATLKDFKILEADYKANGLQYLPPQLQAKLGVKHEYKGVKHSVPADSRYRVLHMLEDQGAQHQEDIAKELGGISLTALRPTITSLVKVGCVSKGSGWYRITLFGLEELEKLEKDHERSG